MPAQQQTLSRQNRRPPDKDLQIGWALQLAKWASNSSSPPNPLKLVTDHLVRAPRRLRPVHKLMSMQAMIAQ